MERVFRLRNLDCAHCANKIQNKIAKVNGVLDCQLNFMTLKLMLEVEDNKMDDVLIEAEKIIKKIEPACVLVK